MDFIDGRWLFLATDHKFSIQDTKALRFNSKQDLQEYCLDHKLFGMYVLEYIFHPY